MTASVDGEEVTIETKDGCTVVTTATSTTDTCEAGNSIDDRPSARWASTRTRI